MKLTLNLNANTMKKFTLMLSLVALASFTFAQVAGVYAPIKDKAQKTMKSQLKGGEEVAWEVTFEEDPAVWTIGHDAGDLDWIVSDTTITSVEFENGVDFTDDGVPVGAMVSSMWLYMGRRDLGEYSESGGNFAYFDAITNVLTGTETAYNAWIQFDDIDLTDESNPKLRMYQNFKALNSGATFFDYSLDDGTTWTSIQLNGEVEGNQYGDDILEVVLPTEIGGESNVDIRFRFQADNTAVNGYGWEIDDIKIVHNPDVDMVLKKGVMNFFDYVDYTDPANADYFHLSSHYGMLPEEQFDNDAAVMVFNGIVESKGNLDIAPDFNVTVFDPEMTEIYNETVTGISLSTFDVDTIDVLVEFGLDAEPMNGEYTVVYNVVATDDAFMEDNIDTTYFHVTDNMMARDVNNVTSYTGPGVWQSGGNDGDMLGTNYIFMYETTIESLDVFISSATSAGTSLVAHVMQYDDVASDWIDIGTSELTVVSEDMIGDWYSFTFADPIEITPDPETGAMEVKAAIEFYFNEEDIYIGVDPTVNVSIWGASWYFVEGDNANSWLSLSNWSSGGLSIRLATPSSNAVANIDAEKVGVYPNPNNGIFTIENVRGADVEVYNLVGQRVYAASNLEQNVKIDLSDLSEGTYIVKVSGLNDVKTQKINIVK